METGDRSQLKHWRVTEAATLPSSEFECDLGPELPSMSEGSCLVTRLLPGRVSQKTRQETESVWIVKEVPILKPALKRAPPARTHQCPSDLQEQARVCRGTWPVECLPCPWHLLDCGFGKHFCLILETEGVSVTHVYR